MPPLKCVPCITSHSRTCGIHGGRGRERHGGEVVSSGVVMRTNGGTRRGGRHGVGVRGTEDSVSPVVTCRMLTSDSSDPKALSIPHMTPHEERHGRAA